MVLGGIIQGAIGQPFGNESSGVAYGVLNEILGTYRGKDGIARPSRYEVLLLPPSGQRGSPNVNSKSTSESVNNTSTTNSTSTTKSTDDVEDAFDKLFKE